MSTTACSFFEPFRRPAREPSPPEAGADRPDRPSPVRRIDEALVLTPCSRSNVPRAVRGRLVTLDHSGALLLISPVPMTAGRILLKRISPRFDRKFLRCQLLPAPDAEERETESGVVFYYGVELIGFAEWSSLTHQLAQGLLTVSDLPKPRPSMLRPAATAAKKAEESLMPLLSAIGLVVVYACNLNW